MEKEDNLITWIFRYMTLLQASSNTWLRCTAQWILPHGSHAYLQWFCVLLWFHEQDCPHGYDPVDQRRKLTKNPFRHIETAETTLLARSWLWRLLQMRLGFFQCHFHVVCLPPSAMSVWPWQHSNLQHTWFGSCNIHGCFMNSFKRTMCGLCKDDGVFNRPGL